MRGLEYQRRANSKFRIFTGKVQGFTDSYFEYHVGKIGGAFVYFANISLSTAFSKILKISITCHIKCPDLIK